jgi:hypothetical protein
MVQLDDIVIDGRVINLRERRFISGGVEIALLESHCKFMAILIARNNPVGPTQLLDLMYEFHTFKPIKVHRIYQALQKQIPGFEKVFVYENGMYQYQPETTRGG